MDARINLLTSKQSSCGIKTNAAPIQFEMQKNIEMDELNEMRAKIGKPEWENLRIFSFIVICLIFFICFHPSWVDCLKSYRYPDYVTSSSQKVQYFCTHLDCGPLIKRGRRRRNWNYCRNLEICFLTRLLCHDPVDTNWDQRPDGEKNKHWIYSSCYKSCFGSVFKKGVPLATKEVLAYWNTIQSDQTHKNNFHKLIDRDHLNIASFVKEKIELYENLQAIAEAPK